jgi:hypothetical protein
MKCLCCREIFIADRRNFRRQKYCSKAPCQLVSKRQSQRRWLAQPENQNYFRDPLHSVRVRKWRKKHPGYWRKGKKKPSGTLQDTCPPQSVDKQPVEQEVSIRTLQDVCKVQVPLLVGLAVATLGPALQENIVPFLRRLVASGEDILDMPSRKVLEPNPYYDPQKTPAPRPVAANPASL